MKRSLSTVFSLIFAATQVFAADPPVSLKGQDGTKLLPKWNLQVPYQQATNLGGIDALIETGNDNILANPGFEHSTVTTSWTVSNGSASADTTNFIQGKKSISISLSAVNGDIVSQSVTPPAANAGLNFDHTIFVKTSLANLQICALQAASEVQCQDVPGTDTWQKITSTIAAPSSGSVGIKLKSTSSATGTVNVDVGYVGITKSIAQISQASLFATAKHAKTANCSWNGTNATASLADFAADADCPTPTVTGRGSAPSTKIPGVTIASAPAGTYYIVMTAAFGSTRADAASGGAVWAISDGTTTTPEHTSYSEGELYVPIITGTFTYTTAQTNITWRPAYRLIGTSTNAVVAADNQDFAITVYYFPTQQTAITPPEQGWYVDANIAGGNPNLGVSNVASYTEITNGSLTMTPKTGSAPVGIMCSSTNAASAPSTGATTCAAGNESIGANFNIAKAGAHEVCIDFSWFGQVDSAESITAGFQLIETPTNAQTLTLEGGTRTVSEIAGMTIASGTDSVIATSIRSCSIFPWASSGNKGVRLMYEHLVTGTPDSSFIFADSNAAYGQPDIHISVKPITGTIPSPILVGSLTSNSSGVERIERATILCDDSGSSVTRQSGSWVSAVGTRSGANCSLTIASGTFSEIPTCTSTRFDTAGNAVYSNVGFSSTTSGGVTSIAGTSAGAVDYTVQVLCMGPR